VQKEKQVSQLQIKLENVRSEKPTETVDPVSEMKEGGRMKPNKVFEEVIALKSKVSSTGNSFFGFI
jgi:hypothetical protein